MVLELSLLVDLGLIVVFATFFNFIARALKQPSLLAYILAGVVLGPAGLGSLNWTFFDIPLGLTSLAEIRILSELGVAFLLFSIGVESDFSKLKSVGKVVLFAGILQVLITTTFVVLISNFLNLLSFSEALLLGLAISFSSTMVVIKILSDQKKLDTLHGRILVGILIVQDIIAIVLLPFITNISLFLSGEQLLQFLFSGAILVIISFALSKYVYPAVYQFAAKSHELLYLAALSSCFVFIFLAEFILHLPIPLGAFMAGLALSALPYSLDIYAAIKGLRDFFVTIFFTTLGLQLTFGSFFAPSFVSLFIFSLFVLFVVKFAGHYLTVLFAGYGKELSFNAALSLSQVSEFSFILASQALAVGLISSQLFSLVILLVAVSMVLTPYFFRYSSMFFKFSRSILFPRKYQSTLFDRKVSGLEEVWPIDKHVIVVGAGTFGFQLISQLAHKQAVLAVDQNPELVQSLMDRKINAVYGFIENPELWSKLNLENARLLILAIPEVKASLALLTHAKQVNPELTVFARAHYYTEALALYNQGADFVCMPHVLGSNAVLERANIFLETESLFESTAWAKMESLEKIKEEAFKEKKLHLAHLKDLEKEYCL